MDRSGIRIDRRLVSYGHSVSRPPTCESQQSGSWGSLLAMGFELTTPLNLAILEVVGDDLAKHPL